MKNAEISFGHGHVWYGELAQRALFVPSATKEVSIEATSTPYKEPVNICLRLTLMGRLGSYGILGCQFVPKETGQTIIKVNSVEETSDSTLKAGLSSDLAQTVLNQAVARLKNENFLGSGILYFDRGEHHEVDSNQEIFQKLTLILLACLNPNVVMDTKADLEAFVTNLLKAK